ncbi:hypothetical protein [Microbacterium sp. C7(2022)]|uniref:hypothetical protein n=1 Tax=Microbacterium sp. C7(2022) TaxID=2992759 RepID=UPI00237A67A8|nr:hypothetical protein [Microbacterium sp. C7(2022)]MDE0547644.1 hypothetical protein [Microbacterium sp. C7(2022)]
MSYPLHRRFNLVRVSSMEWMLVDASLTEHDPRRIVGRVYEVDELEFDVTWSRDLGLPEHFMSPADALEALERSTVPRRRASTRPVPIPHLPPLSPGTAA